MAAVKRVVGGKAFEATCLDVEHVAFEGSSNFLMDNTHFAPVGCSTSIYTHCLSPPEFLDFIVFGKTILVLNDKFGLSSNGFCPPAFVHTRCTRRQGWGGSWSSGAGDCRTRSPRKNQT